MDPEQGYDVLKKIYIDFVENRTGYLHRAKPLWLNNVLSSNAATGPAHMAVAHAADATPVGYIVYHVRNDKTGHPTRAQELLVKDFIWLTPDAYRSLWTWLARHDLVGRIDWPRAPLDDPATELFVEPRLLNKQSRDGIWLRIVDVARSLEARGYQTSGSITLEVAPDDLTPWNGGRYALECSPDGATVKSSRGQADLMVSIKALASLYNGYRSARQLAAWGLVEGDDSALARATQIFATRHVPHCPDNF